MLSTRDLLAAVKASQGLPSNYALARFLKVTDVTVANWHHGRTCPDDEMGAKLAALAGLDEGFVVASMHAERAQNEGARQVWQRIAQRLQAAAAILAAVIVSLVAVLAPPGAAHASPLAGPSPATGDERGSVYYVKWLARLLATLTRRPRTWCRTPSWGYA
ncbi:MAG: hypothetical protein RL268_504 [Pseudomonadota bacterium]|jgi:hypothetical protein